MSMHSTAEKIPEVENNDVDETIPAHEHASTDLTQDERSQFMHVTAAIALALPAIGMIAGGFSAGSQVVGFMGVGALIVYAILYYTVLHALFTYEV
ncbi:MAG: hypothetical protein ACREQ4_07620 [Candidatus Binataceae bacterium]